MKARACPQARSPEFRERLLQGLAHKPEVQSSGGRLVRGPAHKPEVHQSLGFDGHGLGAGNYKTMVLAMETCFGGCLEGRIGGWS